MKCLILSFVLVLATLHSAVHHLAVLSGAYVSHARYSVMTHSDDIATCPYCQDAVGSKQHVWWDCLQSGRPPGIAPGTQKQRLLGWPTGTQQDDAVVDYLADLRKRDLQLIGMTNQLAVHASRFRCECVWQQYALCACFSLVSLRSLSGTAVSGTVSLRLQLRIRSAECSAIS